MFVIVSFEIAFFCNRGDRRSGHKLAYGLSKPQEVIVPAIDDRLQPLCFDSVNHIGPLEYASLDLLVLSHSDGKILAANRPDLLLLAFNYVHETFFFNRNILCLNFTRLFLFV